MSNGNNNNSKAPLIIIGVVLVVVLAAVWWLMNRKPSAPAASNRATTTARTPAAVNAAGATPPNLLGSPNASVTVEEFADFQCPTCAVKHPVVKELTSLYGSRIKFVFRNFPLAIPAHDKAYDAAVAAEAAGLQGRFWEMQNLLFTNQQTWTSNPNYRQLWEGYASQIGIDVERFKSDMAGTMTKQRVDADLQRGRALQVNSTPSIFVNGMLIPFEQMTVEGMRTIIDGELQKAQTNQSSQTNSAAGTTK
ncbi:MAG TPA: thioredoxin domain-containing protein [Pyrinomonadaceae bacterium]|jgi:protein-disulfide isomerase